jgi:hypothetical protein
MHESPRRRPRKNQILDHLIALTNPEIRRFLRRHKIDGADAENKGQLRRALRTAITRRKIATENVVAFLDEVTPWGKQHVYFFKGGSPKNWRDPKWVADHLTSHKIFEFLDARSDKLELPEHLEIARITADKSQLRITAIRKREGWVRDETYDNVKKKGEDGRPLWLKGYTYQVLRGIVAFEWNLIANEAFLQITQLPSNGSYEGVRDEFKKKIESWLDLGDFDAVDLGRAVKKLHQLEEKGKPVAISHAADYDRLGHRRVSVRSTSTKVPLRGDSTVDGILKLVTRTSIPRIGDFYFGADGAAIATDGKPHSRKHIIIIAQKNRVNFATPDTEKGIRSVLTELRKLSA